MKITLVGVGKMGAQIARKLIDAGHQVVAVDPSAEAVAAVAEFGAIATTSREESLTKYDNEQVVVWLMIPAQFVEAEIASWCEMLPAGSIVVDGGNTDFRHTPYQAELVHAKGSQFVDVGVSGGILGMANGFSMMAGGDEAAYRTITPILDVLAQPKGGHNYFGGAGAGHYIKMVHNAIEYGMMESLAEGYRMLHEGPYKGLNLAAIGNVWQQSSVIESNLNALAAQIMSEDQTMAHVQGFVAESGEARWTLEVAKEANIELPAIQSAFDVRVASATGDINYTTKLLAELRNKFGGHAINKDA